MSGLQQYISTIEKFKLLDQEETNELFKKFNNGDSQAKNKLINHNLRLVVKTATRYEHYDENKIMDLIQEGTLGLIRAIELFDVEKGFRLSTFACRWIDSKIAEYFGSNVQSSYVPIHIKRAARKINKIEKMLISKETTGELDKDILAEYNRTSEKPLKENEFLRIKALNSGSISMDAPINDSGSNTTIQNFISSEDDKLEKNLSMRDLSKWVEMKINHLPENQQKAIGSYFGINRNVERKYKEVGEEMGCTGSRAQQLVVQGLGKLKRMAEIENVQFSMF